MLVTIALVLAALGNGANYYLKRIGVLEADVYARVAATYCPADAGESMRGCSCMQQDDTSIADGFAITMPRGETEVRHFVYRNDGAMRVFKLLKDALFVGFVALSLLLMARRREPVPAWRNASPMLWLGGALAIGLVVALSQSGPVLALVGLRGFAFVAVAAVAAWFARSIAAPARAMALLLLLEALLIVPEFLFGMPLRPCPYSFRVAGTLVLPNSLGVFAVVALAFHDAFAERGDGRWLPAIAALVLILAAGSGTGLVALCVWFAIRGSVAVPQRRRLLALVGSITFVVALRAVLPTVTQRPDIYDSIFAQGGRVDTLLTAVQRADFGQLLFGQGLGFGSNAAVTLPNDLHTPLATGHGWRALYADSTPTTLLLQLGLFGVTAFYGLLAFAFWRDRAARPLYVVFAVTSLAMSLPELFPVNFLLGVTLAHSLFVVPAASPETHAPANSNA